MNTETAVFDCDIHPLPKTSKTLARYLPGQWREYLETFGPWTRAPFRGTSSYPKLTPALSRRDAWPPDGGPPGSDLDFMRMQHLDANNIEHGILQPLFPSAKDQRNLGFGIALSRAINDWQVAEWTQLEPRLKASIVVPCEDAPASVAEIDARAAQSDFVQVFLTMRTREPLGERRYWPIYEAAQRHNLPVGIHVGGVTGLPAASGGWPSYYFEEHQSHPVSAGALLASLVFNGVFEAFPQLRVICIEASFGWAPSLCWRLDQQWQRLRAEVPHLKRPPSDYIKSNVWFTTQPIEEPSRPQYLLDLMEWTGFDRLLFATDYPHWDFDDPRTAIKAPLSQEHKRMIFNGNARSLYRLN